MITKTDFEIEIRKLDPKAELLERGMGIVIAFIEPNKLPQIAEFMYFNAPIGICIEYWPRPEYLPDPLTIQGG